MRWGILLVGLVACKGGEGELSFTEDIAPIVQLECSGCHAGEQAEGGLDLLADPYGAMVDAPSLQSSYPLIEPGSALDSYLWHKVNGTQMLAEGAGSNMPLGRWLSDDEIALFAEWIDLGAPE